MNEFKITITGTKDAENHADNLHILSSEDTMNTLADLCDVITDMLVKCINTGELNALTATFVINGCAEIMVSKVVSAAMEQKKGA